MEGKVDTKELSAAAVISQREAKIKTPLRQQSASPKDEADRCGINNVFPGCRAGLSAKGSIGLEFGEAALDILSDHFFQALRAEGFAGEAGSDAAVGHGVLEILKGGLCLPLAREPTHHAAQEAVTRTRGVKHAAERIGRASEEFGRSISKEEAAVLATLHDDIARSFRLETATRFHEVGRFSELLGFPVIDHQQVEALQHIMQALVGDIDPQVHGIRSDELDTFALIQHLQLIVRAHVAQDHKLRRGSFRGELGLPVFKDIDAHLQSVAHVHIFMVLAGPGEALSLAAFQTVERDILALQKVEVGRREIAPHHSSEMDVLGEEAGGKRRVSSGATKQTVLTALLRDDVINGDGAGDEKGHGC